MKRFKLREGEQFKAAELLQTVLGQGGGQGITIAEMATRIGLIGNLKERAGKKDITLPNEDFEFLKGLYMRFPFGLVHTDLIDISNDLKEAQDVQIEDVTSAKLKKA